MRPNRQRARLVRLGIYTATLAALGWLAIVTDWAQLQANFFDPGIFWDLFPEILTRAARNTLIFTAFGFSGGLAIGMVLALMRLSTVTPYRWAAAVYIEVFRGLPALITIVLIGFVLPIALQVRVPGPMDPGASPWPSSPGPISPRRSARASRRSQRDRWRRRAPWACAMPRPWPGSSSPRPFASFCLR